MKFKTITKIQTFIILLLILLDQIIKTIVKNYYGAKVPILFKIIYFKPTLNKYYSWFASLLHLPINVFVHVVSNIIIMLLVYYAYKFYYYKQKDNIFIRLTEIFWFSGSLSSLIDKVYWNGSLDYILINHFFAFDLKDVYLSFFQIGIFILILKNWFKLSDISSKQLLLDYIKFIKR